MRNLSIRLQDSEGKVYRWTIERVPRAVNVGVGIPTRVISGWQFIDHEGYTRFAEGNWQDLVARFKGTAENYGLSLLSELS
jgi:hypothetical protein